ncbi:MAG: 50S ribosomal protein L20, partial [Paracoccaceae bacterium]
MSRTVSGPVTKARHKKVIKAAKGYYGARSRLFKTATQAVDKANQ